MTITELFPKFSVPVIFKELKTESGQYWYKSDVVVLDSSLKKSMPGLSKLVFLHEMMHATGSRKRLMRVNRLITNFGEFNEGTLSYRVEECIAEVACMVAAMKLGLFNEYSRAVIVHGLEKNYTSDIYLPIREIRAAVKYFASDDESFEQEIQDTKEYLEAYMDIKFQDSYQVEKTA
jgi:hypothetical protein